MFVNQHYYQTDKFIFSAYDKSDRLQLFRNKDKNLEDAIAQKVLIRGCHVMSANAGSFQTPWSTDDLANNT